MGRFTLPQAIRSSEPGSRTTKRSLGDRPVCRPVSTTSGPPSASARLVPRERVRVALETLGFQKTCPRGPSPCASRSVVSLIAIARIVRLVPASRPAWSFLWSEARSSPLASKRPSRSSPIPGTSRRSRPPGCSSGSSRPPSGSSTARTCATACASSAGPSAGTRRSSPGARRARSPTSSSRAPTHSGSTRTGSPRRPAGPRSSTSSGTGCTEGRSRPVIRRLAVGRWLDDIFDYRAARLRELLG